MLLKSRLFTMVMTCKVSEFVFVIFRFSLIVVTSLLLSTLCLVKMIYQYLVFFVEVVLVLKK